MANLDDLYRDIILDHYRSPRNRGELPPPARRVEGFNPLCGDELVLYVDVRDGVLVDIKMTGHGCSISQASSSLMSAAVKGRPLDEVHATIESFKTMMGLREASLSEGRPDDDDASDLRSMKEINALAGVVKFPVRIKCATLAWNTLEQALAEPS